MATDAGEVITQPRGGGALSGLGESFSPDLHTGTAGFTVPLTVPKGRNGMTPRLALSYSAAAGNGPFGLGWTVTVPSIARKTAKGVPRYDDAADVFVLPGAEDLIAVARLGARTRYRPAREESFAEIEHDGSADCWRVRSKDGITSLYGARFSASVGGAPEPDPGATLRRPSGRPFAWLLCDSRDPFGNLIRFEYEPDEPRAEAARWRDLANGHVFRQRLLRRIRYVDFDDGGVTRFLVSVEFEYEDRPDRFSNFRVGFELRRTQRCRCVTVRTHSDPDLAQPVRSYMLEYLDQRPELADRLPLNGVSLLSRIRMIGYEANLGGVQGTAREEMAPLELGYTAFEPARRRFEPIIGQTLPPGALSSRDYELADLTGDALPDVLELNSAARYWRNLGDRLDRPRPLRAVPGGLSLADPGVRLLDADGDGRADLLSLPTRAYFPLRLAPEWDARGLRRYAAVPSVDLDDPEVRLVDLDGDGLTDVLRTGARFECFFNATRAQEAWTRTRRVARRRLDVFPDVNFSDPAVRLADMTGDGLQDIVVVHGGGIHYWPNLGHGDFGPRVVMAGGPRLPAGHDPRRLLLGDVDGDGAADLIYVEDGRVTLWVNHCGDGWGPPVRLKGTPRVSDADLVRITDLRGTGLGGLLWAKSNGGLARDWLLFLDFCGGRKPYLLDGVDNNIGAVTRVEYRPSTEQRLEDEHLPTTRWRTPLPFPVHVVTRVETSDEISGSHRTSEYRYRHGYWDGRDREFRGFGRVDARDIATGPGTTTAPPVETRTWFHLGPVEREDGGWEELDLSAEYWPGDPVRLARPAGTARLLRSLAPQHRRDAVRCLKGSMLRTEQYALDGSPRQDRPYIVIETSQSIWAVDGDTLVERLPEQPAAGDRGIFFCAQVAVRTTQWERGEDPQTSVSYSGGHDGFGRPRDDVKVVLPRRSARRASLECAVVGTVEPDERDVLATLTRRTYGAPDTPDLYLHDKLAHIVVLALAESRQVTECDPANVAAVVADQVAAAEGARERLNALLAGWAVGDPVPAGVELLGHMANRYDGAPFEGRADGQLGPYGTLAHSEELVFTDAGLDALYGARRPAYLGGSAAAPAGAPARTAAALGYSRQAATALRYCAGWYADALRARYDARGNVDAVRDVFGTESAIGFDRFRLLPESVTDAVGLVTRAVYDYRVLQPASTTDPNGTWTHYRYTPLGLLEKLWLEGPAGEGGTEDRPGTRFEYALRSWLDTRVGPSPQPIHVHVRRREEHAAEGISDAELEHREYSDGFGRLVQERVEAEPLDYSDAGLPTAAGAAPGAAVGIRVPKRVAVSGWQVYDDKGRVVRKYEPYYSIGWDFAREGLHGVYAEITYDPLGRITRTTMPDGSEQRVVHGIPATLADPERFEPTSWESYACDPTDLDGLRAGDYAASTTVHGAATNHGTPTSRVSDGLGRVIAQVERNGATPATDWFLTRSHYDLRGNLLSVVDALGRTTLRRGYDLRDRCLRIESIDAGLRTSVLDAAGGVVEARDSKGAFVAHEYDRLHRLVRLWARDHRMAPVTLRERLAYGDGGDPGQLAADRAANRQANRLGRVAEHWDEAGVLELERYDFIGNVSERVRRVLSDQAIAAGVPVDWSDPGATAALDATRFEISVRYNGLGRPARITYPREALPRPGEAQAVRPVLDLLYDEAGGLTRVELDGRAYVERLSYNARGQPVLCVHGNGLMTRQAFDPISFRLARVRSERATRAAGGGDDWEGTGPPLRDSTYLYDPGGSVVAIDDRVPGCGVRVSAEGPDRLLRTFTYDPQQRLLSATGRAAGAPVPSQANAPDHTETYVESYRHDPVDNMLERSYSAPGGNPWTRRFGLAGEAPADWRLATSNRLTSAETGAVTESFGHDGSGNLIRQNLDRTLRFDHADRLIEYREQQGAQPPVLARYLYGSDGERVKKWTQGRDRAVETTVYVEGLFELQRWTEQGQSRRQNTLHVRGHRGLAALVRHGDQHGDDAGPPEQFHLRDHLGSVAAVIDGSGAWINREEYFPFGETSFGTFARKRYRFLGRERDEESDLCYLGARYYSPTTARFITCDSLLAPPPGYHLNAYSFVRGSPLSLRDPHGQQEKGALEFKEPETSFWDWGSGFRRTKADFIEFWEKHFAPGNDRTGPPEPPKPIDAKYFLPRPPPPAPRLPELIWRPAPNQFDKDVAEFKAAVRGVAATVQMSFIATDGIAPHAKYIFMVPGWYTKAAGYSLTEGAMLERASLELAEVNAARAAMPPAQIWFPDGVKIGPGYRTFAEAFAAKAHSGAHVLEAVHTNAEGRVLGHWWEVSESGVGSGRYGDTEQKALMRVVLREGDTLEMHGTWSACSVPRGCDAALQAASIESKADIIYRYLPNAAGDDSIFHYEAGLGRPDY